MCSELTDNHSGAIRCGCRKEEKPCTVRKLRSDNSELTPPAGIQLAETPRGGHSNHILPTRSKCVEQGWMDFDGAIVIRVFIHVIGSLS